MKKTGDLCNEQCRYSSNGVCCSAVDCEDARRQECVNQPVQPSWGHPFDDDSNEIDGYVDSRSERTILWAAGIIMLTAAILLWVCMPRSEGATAMAYRYATAEVY